MLVIKAVFRSFIQFVLKVYGTTSHLQTKYCFAELELGVRLPHFSKGGVAGIFNFNMGIEANSRTIGILSGCFVGC